jgi:aromatic-L-amino-acid decarboxylase
VSQRSSSAGGFALEPTADEKAAIGEAAVRYVVEFLEGLEDAPASDLERALEATSELRDPPPERGTHDFGAVLGRVREAARHGFETAGPGYLAFIPGGGLFTAAIADFVATGVNRFVNVWNAAPAFTQIEATVIRWLADLFELPPSAGGILTSGGSMANFSAILSARRDRLGDELSLGTIYASDQTHASVAKAAILAGFPAANVRSLPKIGRASCRERVFNIV